MIEAWQAWQPELAANRRDTHAHPELGMEEVRTSALVARYLEGLGIEVATGIGKLGVAATIRGSLPGQRVIGLRADMDAPPIEEATGKPRGVDDAGADACLRP
ncbi:amidohydrolase/hippurate hydrolase [Falsiroseomonas stagni DSM 19981]|uniref:Amidohydrolase/hippurate hydrolase n=1 Tax=Falsiroseomonas stagni DSM 19981 TaxID=1123062 RepID=A0A1I4BAG9_9PROT|nr:amidohydrolase/hippurate hydrolase [Falsiroseomonas stagni DSM 19981]